LSHNGPKAIRDRPRVDQEARAMTGARSGLSGTTTSPAKGSAGRDTDQDDQAQRGEQENQEAIADTVADRLDQAVQDAKADITPRGVARDR